MTLTMIQSLVLQQKKMKNNNSCFFFAFTYNTTATQYSLPGLSLTLLSKTVFWASLWTQQDPNMNPSMHMPKCLPSVFKHSQTNIQVPSSPATLQLRRLIFEASEMKNPNLELKEVLHWFLFCNECIEHLDWTDFWINLDIINGIWKLSELRLNWIISLDDFCFHFLILTILIFHQYFTPHIFVSLH